MMRLLVTLRDGGSFESWMPLSTPLREMRAVPDWQVESVEILEVRPEA